MVVKSKYGGKCPRCRRYFYTGTLIAKEGNGWGPVDCQGCVRKKADLEHIHELERRMMANHNIAYGVFGIPEGAKGTFSPYGFLMKAKEAGEATDEESKAFFSYFGSSMHMDLSD